jgi:hypothetical protein
VTIARTRKTQSHQSKALTGRKGGAIRRPVPTPDPTNPGTREQIETRAFQVFQTRQAVGEPGTRCPTGSRRSSTTLQAIQSAAADIELRGQLRGERLLASGE